MSEQGNAPINVMVAMDFSDELIHAIRDVSPRLHVERHHPKVADKAWANVDVLYTGRRFPNLDQAPNLRWIQLHSAGADHFWTEPISKREGVEVTTMSGIHAVPMAEFCLSMMLAFNYRLPTMLHFQAKNLWQTKDPDDLMTDLYNPRPLRGQTVGIVGYGSIGRELARITRQMGMTVLAMKRDLMALQDTDYSAPGTGDPTGDLPDRLYPPEALVSMVRACDFVVLAIPLTPHTEKLISAEVLAAMKPTAVLINVARGGVVDEGALIETMREQRIGGAALDVFNQEPLPPESPLWALPNVILSPHISGNHATYHQHAAGMFIENLHRYLAGRPLLNLVDSGRGY